MNGERILFVTWDGPQVHYLESLFVPIFVGLGAHGHHVDVLQFGWGDERPARAACEVAGLGYRRVDINRTMGSVGPFLSALRGGRHVNRALAEFGSTLILPRSLFAGLAVLASERQDRPIIWDSDGLAADERREAGGLTSVANYAVLRRVERALTRRADRVLTRTATASQLLAARSGRSVNDMTVVPNGRDKRLFLPTEETARQKVRRSLGFGAEDLVLVYCGSAGAQYAFDEMASIAEGLRAAIGKVCLLVLSGDIDRARALLGPTSSWATMRQAAPEEVPKLLGACDVGLALRRRSLAMSGVAPIKIGEYLLCGLPIIGTAGIGDTSAAEQADVFADASLPIERIVDWVRTQSANRGATRDRARAVGINHFSLGAAVDAYTTVFDAFRNRSTTRGDQADRE